MNYYISYTVNNRYVNYKNNSELDDDDDYYPQNLGGRRPNNGEWNDYISEEQAFYLSGLMDGSISTNKKKPQRHHTPDEIVEMLEHYDVLRKQGADKNTAFWCLGISESTYRKWKKFHKQLKGEQK